MALIRIQKYSSAIKKAQDALEINPKNIKAFYRLSLASCNDGQFDLATRTAKQGLKIKPETKELVKLLETIQQKRKKADKKEQKIY